MEIIPKIIPMRAISTHIFKVKYLIINILSDLTKKYYP